MVERFLIGAFQLLSEGKRIMSYKHGFKIRGAILIAAMLIISLVSTRLSADVGVCGGQNTNLPFTDVSASNIFFCSIAAAYFSGLTNGTTPTTYSPTANVPREQMAAFVTRTLGQGLRRGNLRAALGQWWVPTVNDTRGETAVVGQPMDVKSDGADLWVVCRNPGSVNRVRSSDGKLLGTWTGAFLAERVLIARSMVFVTGNGGSLFGIDPTQPAGPVTELSSSLGGGPSGIAFDGTRIWTANKGTPSLPGSISIITATASPPWTTMNITTGFANPFGILYDGSNIWVTDGGDFTIKKLDSSGGVIQSIDLGGAIFPGHPVFDGTNIWVPTPIFESPSVIVVRTKDSIGNPLPPPPAPNAPFILATLTGNGLNLPLEAVFDGERILVASLNDRLSIWRAQDLSPLGFRSTLSGDQPVAACSDGVNFWVALFNANRLKRF
jgi:hypothetical protein